MRVLPRHDDSVSTQDGQNETIHQGFLRARQYPEILTELC
jgi:hypothetical protein